MNEKFVIEVNILRQQYENFENIKVFIRYLSKLGHITKFQPIRLSTLYIVLRLVNQDILKYYEFICYISFFKVSKVIFFIIFVLHQMMILLVVVKHTLNFNIFIPIFLHCVLQTLDEVASIEIIKTRYRSNV